MSYVSSKKKEVTKYHTNKVRRTDFNGAYKRKRRAQGWTEKRLDMRLTDEMVGTAEDFHGMQSRIRSETWNAALSLKQSCRVSCELQRPAYN